MICAEAATLRENDCNLYDTTQDGIVSITQYITRPLLIIKFQTMQIMNISTYNPIKNIRKHRYKLHIL